MIKKSRRITALLDEIKPCQTLVEIGADHGKISLLSLIENKAEKVIATDISSGCIKKMNNLISQYSEYKDRYFIRCCDGLSCIKKEENDTLLICGLGAPEIINIIKNRKFNFKRYIFSPHQMTYLLRMHLSENDFVIKKDYVVKSDSKYYNIIVCENGDMEELAESQILYGQSSLKNPDFVEFLKTEESKLLNVQIKILKTEKKTKETIKKQKNIQTKLEIIKDILGQV